MRHHVTLQPNHPFDAVDLEGAAVKLRGWWFHGAGKRGTVVFLHGVAANRESGVGIADHFLAQGFDVLAYDSRAHGESDGKACTYGFYEKEDLRRVLDRVTAPPIVLMGTSMGAAIALQAAAEDDRIAEAEGVFHVDDVSPMNAAAHVSAPTLLIHGARDDETPPAHSQRIFAALHEPKRLILVANAGHGNVVDAGVWHEIDAWLGAMLAPGRRPHDLRQ